VSVDVLILLVGRRSRVEGDGDVVIPGRENSSG